MSIPDRFYRIAKHKLGEIKEWVDRVDDEDDEDSERTARRDARKTARTELDEAAAAPAPRSDAGGPSDSPIPMQAPRRSPEEIAQTGRGIPTSSRPAPPASMTAGGQNAGGSGSDALTFHYRLLGVEPGSDFAAVQDAYRKLAARSDPSRFAAGSQDERTARELRDRIEASYKALRDALDQTVRRFDLLEFDDTPAPRPDSAAPEGVSTIIPQRP